MEFVDNDDVLQLLEGRPRGLLSLLKEESTLKTGTGLKLANRYRQAFADNDRFAVPRCEDLDSGLDWIGWIAFLSSCPCHLSCPPFLNQ